MKQFTSRINLSYAFRIILDIFRGNIYLQPMSDFKFITFKELDNIHIFDRNNESMISCCGDIKKNRGDNTHQTDSFTKKVALEYAYNLQIEGHDVCGQCVAHLYSNIDTDKIFREKYGLNPPHLMRYKG